MHRHRHREGMLSKIGVIIPSLMERQFIDLEDSESLEVVVSGMGKVRASFSAHELCTKSFGCVNYKLGAILLTGYAGGLRNVKRGAVVTPTVIWEGDYQVPFEDYPNFVRPPFLNMEGVDPVAFLTQDRFLDADPYKGKMREPESTPVATDMESYAVVYTANRLHIPVYVIKVISDIVGSKSERDFLDSCSQQADKLSGFIKKAILKIQEELK